MLSRRPAAKAAGVIKISAMGAVVKLLLGCQSMGMRRVAVTSKKYGIPKGASAAMRLMAAWELVWIPPNGLSASARSPAFIAWVRSPSDTAFKSPLVANPNTGAATATHAAPARVHSLKPNPTYFVNRSPAFALRASQARIKTATYATPANIDTRVATSQRWDPERFIYASPTALQKWRAAKAKARGAGFARLNIYGDSVTQNNAASETASPKYLNSYPWRLRTLLDKDYGQAGTGVVFPINSSIPDDARWTFTGNFANATTFGPFGSTARNSPTYGNEITFTAECDTYTIYYFGNTN